jgi:DNA recombination protein RmuC
MYDLSNIIIVGIVAFIFGALVVFIVLGRKTSALREQNTKLEILHEAEKKSNEDKIRTLTETREQLSNTFAMLSTEALNRNNESFLKLAQENLKQHQIKSEHELEKKEKSFENLIKPIKEALDKTEQQIHNIEKERKEAYGSLTQHLEQMAQTQKSLHSETRNLVQALRRPEVRGQWGEMTLKRLAELAGMVEHCDFYEQESITTEDGALRPDMIVRMPDGREIVVDAKTPLDAYLSAIEAGDEETKAKELARHARNVRNRVRELASKAYWKQFKNSPDFVVLFIPGEQFLYTALDLDRDLLEEALRQKVILSTPTSFVALLRAVAYGWRQETLAENAEHIRHIGEDLYHRLVVFSDYLQKVGKSLDSSVSHFNKAVGSFDARILPSARKFTDMGISAKKELDTVEQIEKTTRAVESSSEDKNLNH